jgi:hypothetical protein
MGGEEKRIGGFSRKNHGEKSTGKTQVDGRIILECSLKRAVKKS